MYFIFDTETTGLPLKKGWNFDKPNNLSSYDTARLVSISWIVCKDNIPVKEAYYIIRPEGFDIPESSTAIHGISHSQACTQGIPIETVIAYMKADLQVCDTLVAHNIAFDTNIVLSEAYRADDQELVDIMHKKQQLCTMMKGKDVMKVQRYPKLEALYEYFYGEPIVHAHNAQYDTLHCYKCFIKLFPLKT